MSPDRDPANNLPKKQKILYVITKSSWGGATRYVYELASSLPKDQYDVVVAFGHTNNSSKTQKSGLKERLDAAGIRSIPIPSLQRDINPLSDLRAFFFLIGLLWREKPDVIHLNSSKIGGLGALAGRIVRLFRSKARGRPMIIFTGHGWAFNEDRNSISKTAIIFLHWLTVLLADKTIAVSLKLRSQISNLPFMQGKIVVIHNGIPAKHFESELLSKKAARNGMGIITPETKSAEILIGTASELHKNKGLDFLIKAAAELMKEPGLPRFRILILGEGEERPALEELIIKYNVKGRVILKGHLENARIYLKAFDVFTLTSRTEGLPYAILEAGIAELPVLASNIGGIPEIIDQLSSGILVTPGDIKAITAALTLLIKEPAHRIALGAALKTHTAHSFSLDQMVAETEKVYLSAKK